MLNLLLKPLLGVASQAVTGFVKTKQAKAELKLTIFDLLKQNQNISRSITGSYIEDNQTQILTQYFMLSFVYNIRSFGQGQAPVENDRLQQLRQRFGNGQGGFGGDGCSGDDGSAADAGGE